MNIQYLDSNAFDLAMSFQQLFTGIGFEPRVMRDTLLSSVGLVKINANDSDLELIRKIISSIETVTNGRIKFELKSGEFTTIFIGQKG
jgi:hypothetical protein